MAKNNNNNKGFSLVEIMIAIAILTILLVPIMQQFSQTMSVSRTAKQQQYANESATYSLECFKSGTLAELEDQFGAPTVTSAECDVYDASGNLISATPVDYSVYQYTLPNEKLGPKQIEYTKTVTLDDLSLMLLAADAGSGDGYKISYDNPSAPSGFTRADDGSLVMDSNSDGIIDGIVCDVVTNVDNPNDVSLGDVQNYDSKKVAIINGYASNFDAQAETAFYAAAMDNLKEYDYESWQQALLHTSNDSVLNSFDYSNNQKKLTKIYVDKKTDIATSSEYYIVKCDVYYENSYSLTPSTTGVPMSFHDEFHYNVFSQKFNTSECPSIYLEYQPYTNEVSSTLGVIYSANDRIVVDNYVDDANIYIYKPINDQMNVREGRDDAYYDAIYASNSLDDAKNILYKFYTTNTRTTEVTFNICDASPDNKPASVFTNILNTFNTTAFSDITTAVAEGEGASNGRTDFSGTIGELEDYERYEDRLWTVKVILDPVDDSYGMNTITLTGAKGEN